ncbi:MAG: DNA topoisomerase IV subunit A [Enhygromyxa sp.]
MPRPPHPDSGDPSPSAAATVELIESIAQEILDAINRGELPELELPRRSLSNVSYDRKREFLRLGGRRKRKRLSPKTARSFAQTLALMAVSKQMVERGDFATKREAYYVSKNWGACRFDNQAESDATMDDIEALASLHGLFREQLGFFPEEHGGSVVGPLRIVDRDPETGADILVDCAALGSGAYTIPHAVEQLRFDTDAAFILAIETGGMFQRLHNHRFWRARNCVLVELGGVPTRATRRFVRRLADQRELPVYCFTDCDPYGVANIYRTFKVGSGNAAHVNEFLSVPRASFLGVTPQDIVDFDLHDAAVSLSPTDLKRARDAIDHDPFFRAHPAWIAALEQMLALGVRAEQQALAKWGLNFVIERYLPAKLAAPERFLP